MIEEFKQIVGVQTYAAFVRMLKVIGPEARTHRSSVVIAAVPPVFLQGARPEKAAP